VRESDQFAKILKWVVTLGNVLNQNTRLASAGFSLESLSSVCVVGFDLLAGFFYFFFWSLSEIFVCWIF
jgi:hypothetical protein